MLGVRFTLSADPALMAPPCIPCEQDQFNIFLNIQYVFLGFKETKYLKLCSDSITARSGENVAVVCKGLQRFAQRPGNHVWGGCGCDVPGVLLASLQAGARGPHSSACSLPHPPPCHASTSSALIKTLKGPLILFIPFMSSSLCQANHSNSRQVLQSLRQSPVCLNPSCQELKREVLRSLILITNFNKIWPCQAWQMANLLFLWRKKKFHVDGPNSQ